MMPRLPSSLSLYQPYNNYLHTPALGGHQSNKTVSCGIYITGTFSNVHLQLPFCEYSSCNLNPLPFYHALSPDHALMQRQSSSLTVLVTPRSFPTSRLLGFQRQAGCRAGPHQGQALGGCPVQQQSGRAQRYGQRHRVLLLFFLLLQPAARTCASASHPALRPARNCPKYSALPDMTRM